MLILLAYIASDKVEKVFSHRLKVLRPRSQPQRDDRVRRGGHLRQVGGRRVPPHQRTGALQRAILGRRVRTARSRPGANFINIFTCVTYSRTGTGL